MSAPTVEPITFRIVRDLHNAIKLIRRADGYYHNVNGSAVKLDPDTDVDTLLEGKHRPFVILDVAADVRQYFPQDEMKVRQPITLYFVSDSNPTDDEDRMRVFFRSVADVEKAMRVDASRGGLAMDTLITDTQLRSNNGSAEVWSQIEIEVSYYRTHGQPT